MEGVGGRRRGVVAETEEHLLLFTQSCSALMLASSLEPRLASSVGHGSLDEAVQQGKSITPSRTKNDTCDRAHVSGEHVH